MKGEVFNLYLVTISGSRSFVDRRSRINRLGHSASFFPKWFEVWELLWTLVGIRLFPELKVELETPDFVSTHALLIQVSVVCEWIHSIPNRSKAHCMASYVVDCFERPIMAMIFFRLVWRSLKVAFSVFFHCRI